MATTKTKVCRICGVEKPLSEFYVRNDTHKHRTECKQCLLKEARYRVTGWQAEDIEEAYMSQKGRCAICGCVLDTSSKTVMVCDHNHRTGKHRGLLCTQCNVGLGNFRDSIDHLKSAIQYLQRHNN